MQLFSGAVFSGNGEHFLVSCCCPRPPDLLLQPTPTLSLRELMAQAVFLMPDRVKGFSKNLGEI